MQIERARIDHPWWVEPGGELLRSACGSGYMTDDDLRAVVADEASAVFVAHGPSGLLGISLVAVADPGVLAQLTRSLSALGLTDNLPTEEPIGWLRAGVVDPAVRGQGIGDQGVKAGLEFLRQKGCRAAYAVSWVSGTGQQSDGVQARNGFTRLGVIANYWSDVLDYRGFCAVCGKPCRCAAIIMRNRIGFTTADERTKT